MTSHRPPIADLILAAVALALTVLVALAGLDHGVQWYVVAEIAIHLGLTAMVAVRRTRRRTSFVATYLLLALLAALVWIAPVNLGVSPLVLCAPLSLYVVARHEPTIWGIAGLLLGIAGAFISPAGRMPGGGSGLVPLMILGMVGTYLWASGRRRTELAHRELVERQRREHERALARQVELAEEAERARIAREVHDIVAHSLAVVTVQANTGLALGGEAQLREALTGVRDASRTALNELRSLVSVLRDNASDQGVSGDLLRVPALAAEAEASGVRLTSDLPGEETLQRWQQDWPAPVRLAVVRIVQEGLSNVIKHGGPEPRATLTLAEEGGACRVEITNDAVARGESGGYGLPGLRERVALSGGTITSGTRGDGFELRVSLPVEGEEDRR
ncbi:sensor histidine kinase [Enemella sp. A6]|uniref:sensor histidine kinase n=1 Tax=Enemella sp. A6 TaxID=3440152 RepID=UPI003EBABF53